MRRAEPAGIERSTVSGVVKLRGQSHADAGEQVLILMDVAALREFGVAGLDDRLTLRRRHELGLADR